MDEPRKPTPTERYHEAVMAFATRPAAPPESSVTISRNAKGVAQFEVTVRGADAAKAAAEAQRLFDLFQSFYPYPANGEAKDEK